MADRLAKAIKDGRLSIARKLIKSGVDCHAVYEHPANTDRGTFLHIAVSSEKADIVKFLLEEEKVDANQRCADGKTSLHIAAHNRFGTCEIVQLLVKNGADCNAMDHIGRSPLHCAAGIGYGKIIEYLVKEGKADINIRNQIGMTPFHVAVCHDVSFIKLMIGLGADYKALDEDGESALFYTAACGDRKVFRFLMEEQGLDLKTYGGQHGLLYSLLRSDAREINFEMVKYLVQEVKLSVNGIVDNTTLLHVVGMHRELEVVKLLVGLGADCNGCDVVGNSLLHLAAWKGKVGVVKYLSEKIGVDLNIRNLKGQTPLLFACTHGKHVCAKLLIDNGADLNIVDVAGYYCLHCAVTSRREGLVRYLVEEKKCDVNKTTNKGLTALHHAAGFGHLKLCKLLVDLGADYKLRGNQGGSILHTAAGNGGNIDILNYLIEQLGQEVNDCNNRGTTPLHYACQSGNLDSVKSLLEKGADYTVFDNEGVSCLGYAARGKARNVYQYLVSEKKLLDTNDRNLHGISPFQMADMLGIPYIGLGIYL